MLCLAVRSPSSMITARRSHKSLFMELQLNLLQSGLRLLPWKFKLLLEVCAEKSFRCLVVEQRTRSCRLLGEGGYTDGPAVGFPSAGMVRRLTELCDTLETSANAAGEVRVLIQQ